MNNCPATIRHLRRDKRSGDDVITATTCGGWLRFVGVNLHKTYGWRKWQQCTSPYCGLYVISDTTGMTRAIQRTDPPKGLFKSEAA